jgi:hypothetical protein
VRFSSTEIAPATGCFPHHSSHTAADAWRLIWTLTIPSSTISKLSRVMLSGMSRGFAGRAIGKFRPNSDLMTEFQTETLSGIDLSS